MWLTSNKAYAMPSLNYEGEKPTKTKLLVQWSEAPKMHKNISTKSPEKTIRIIYPSVTIYKFHSS